ncbi:hypothetical protein PR003_g27072 [Phytophthora rubi]|uniref:Uncharacterized protein n=1 Tax=Phytophthora rubi TaxID=129364 RepID=A0A6A4C455_9STRA|nr:hypothetical protein PR003_g27072 [Phytophthora rubi]
MKLCHDCRVLIGRVLRGARRGALIVEALGNIISLCQQLEKNEDIRSAVHKRLVFVSEELGKTSDEEAMRQNRMLFMYGQTIATFLSFLEKQARKSFIKRLASNRKVLDAIQ